MEASVKTTSVSEVPPPPPPPHTHTQPCQLLVNKQNVKATDEGDELREEEGRETAKVSAALLVTSCLYCTLRGIVVITPLTEPSTGSGLPSSLPPTPLLFSHLAAKWFIWLPRHIPRHIGAFGYWQQPQTLKHMSTYTQTQRNIFRRINILYRISHSLLCVRT
ncbi:uncharacterized protein ACO6RY_13488 [Pungitius sinensis]